MQTTLQNSSNSTGRAGVMGRTEVREAPETCLQQSPRG